MSLDPKLALVVEDDFLQREALNALLRQQRMDVITCDSAEAAELVLGRNGLEISVLIDASRSPAARAGWSSRDLPDNGFRI
jgi:response regulator RpfG family c-di-GMP phosphodiesterase